MVALHCGKLCLQTCQNTVLTAVAFVFPYSTMTNFPTNTKTVKTVFRNVCKQRFPQWNTTLSSLTPSFESSRNTISTSLFRTGKPAKRDRENGHKVTVQTTRENLLNASGENVYINSNILLNIYDLFFYVSAFSTKISLLSLLVRNVSVWKIGKAERDI